MKRVFFDMDGVLAAFDEDYTRRTGATWDHRAQWTKEQKWGMLKEHPYFFRDLPWKKGAKAMFQFVQFANMTDYVPGIMSAASTHIADSDVQKRQWLDREIPEGLDPANIFIVNHREEKARYASPGEILVDDHKLNVEEWIAAGGIGIFFDNAVQVIDDLQKHLNTPARYHKVARTLADHNVDAADKLAEYATLAV